MKLSDLDPKDITAVKKAGGLKLSDVHPDEVTPVSSTSDEPGKLHDALVGLGQGATLGFGKSLLGGAQTAGDVLTGDTDLSDAYENYRKHYKENEDGVDAAKARNPKTVLAAELAGGLLPGLLTAGGSEAITGANAAKTLGQLALEHAGKGALLGGIAGVGGSHGTIENPEEALKDAAFGTMGGGILGAGGTVLGKVASPYAGKALSVTKDALGDAGSFLSKVPGKTIPQGIKDMAADSPFLQKMGYAYSKSREGSQSFAGEDAGQDIGRQLRSTSGSIAKQFMSPLEDSSKLYGEVLKEAGDNGSTLNTGSELMTALDAAKARLSGASTGDSKAALDLLNLHGSSTTDPVSLNQIVSKLNPQQAKTLQNLLRGLGDSQSFNDTPALKDAARALGPAIDASLPEGQLADINSKFSKARQLLEPLINKGEIDPDFQSKSVGDIDPSDLGPKVKSYLEKNLLPNTELSNTKGDNAKLSLSDILDNAKSLNEKGQTQFVDPDSIAAQAKEIGMKTAIRKSIVGETGGSDGVPVSTNLMGYIKGSPLRVAELAGKSVRNLANGTNTIAAGSRKLFQSTNVGLSSVVESLTGAGHVDIANSLAKALSSEDNGAKNAALYTIMQNPNYRKAVFGDDSSEGSK